MIDIQRFVMDIGKLKLNEAYANAYFQIGKMYGIPKDVLEAFESSTFENQEKARGAHVSYFLQPKGNQLMDGFERAFNYQELGKDIFISWEHLPFMRVFAQQKTEDLEKKVDIMKKMLNIGISIEQINEFLETDFEVNEANATGNT